MTQVPRPGRYGVVGNPVAHSLSPQIHAAFGRQTGIALEYGRIEASVEPGAFAQTIERFFGDGGSGLNVTTPFKTVAFGCCGAQVSARAALAGAVNTLRRVDGRIAGDNTDGAGLVADLAHAIGAGLRGLDVLLVGAGGAARGVIGPLFDAGIERMTIVNRDTGKAARLAIAFAPRRIDAASFDQIVRQRFDLVVNATTASLVDVSLPIGPDTLAGASLVYDLMYAARPTRFLGDATRAGAAATRDGLGMLVEQAAESFRVWHGVGPDTGPVLATLRSAIDRPRDAEP